MIEEGTVFKTDRFPGIGFYVDGPATMMVYNGITTPCDLCDADGEIEIEFKGSDWTVVCPSCLGDGDFEESNWQEEEMFELWNCHMIGDDRNFEIHQDDMQVLEDGSVCHCGQLGCDW